MKNLKTIFKSILILCLITSLASCSNDDDGGSDLTSIPSSFLKTYTGNLVYTSSNGNLISVTETGTATISGTNSNYTITFSDGVPAVTGLQFMANDDDGTSFVSIGVNNSVTGINLDDNGLRLNIVIDLNTWSFTTDI